MTLAFNWGHTMTGKDGGNSRPRAERRDATTRAGGIWTQAERDRFITELREARRDANAVTIQGGDIVEKPGSESNRS
jgi:hypothetical protein